MLVVTIEVGYTVSRPVVPDERVSWVLVSAETVTDACLTAAQMVACRRGVVMPTSTVLVDWEL